MKLLTEDEVFRLAREAADIKCDCCLPYYDDMEEAEMGLFLRRFADLIAKHLEEQSQ